MKTLFDTTSLRHHTLKNRIWRSATWLALADNEGNVTDEVVRTYKKLAEGGAAMIVTGLTSIIEHDTEIGGGVKFYNDRFIEEHKRLTDAVRKHGALIMMQTAIVDGPVDELSTEQVEDIVRQFGDAARRAEQAMMVYRFMLPISFILANSSVRSSIIAQTATVETSVAVPASSMKYWKICVQRPVKTL